MANPTSPINSVTGAAYREFTTWFRNDLDVRKDAANQIVAVSPCDLIGRVIVSGFVYALLEVVALVECAVRLAIALIPIPFWAFALCCCDIILENLYTAVLNNTMIALSVPIALIGAQYFNISKTVMPPAEWLVFNTPCTLITCLTDEPPKRAAQRAYDQLQQQAMTAALTTDVNVSTDRSDANKHNH